SSTSSSRASPRSRASSPNLHRERPSSHLHRGPRHDDDELRMHPHRCPRQRNALNDTLMDELGAALLAFDADDSIGCIVVTGGEKAFAAGADIQAMAPYGFVDAYTKGLISRNWETMRRVKKPVIAAVAGFALGGGCEVAMMCDIVIAADTAKFGQPEIKLGI